MNTEDFIKNAINVYGNEYDYSKTIYNGQKAKLIITCRKHGDFFKLPYNHLIGQGCPICSRKKLSKKFSKTTEEFIKDAEKIHGDKYDYSKVKYVNNRTDVCIICKEHGEFLQRPDKHLIGHGCPKCGGSTKLTTEEFIERSKKIHGDKYDYSKVEYDGKSKKVLIICNKHGEFLQRPAEHLNGCGCPICGNERVWDTRGRLTVEEVKSNFVKKHGYLYDYSLFTEYVNTRANIPIICRKHGVFYMTPNNHLKGEGCPICKFSVSQAENEIYNYIETLISKENIIRRDRTILNNFELDIFIPKLKIAFEYNGLLWHSEKFGKDKNYHLKKTKECNKNGISLIHIFEDEWINNKDIVLNRIRHKLGFNQGKKIYGRKCTILEINDELAKNFFQKNSIEDYIESTKYFGAFSNDTLFGVAAFKKNRNNKWTLTMLTTNKDFLTIGVCGKLISFFIKKYKPKYINTFADRRWLISEDNNVFTKIGFKKIKETPPNFRYVNGKHRLRFKNIDETNNMSVFKIWDCGLIEYGILF